MKPPRTTPTLFFRLVIPTTVVFILTIFALIASVFGDPEAPVARWLDANGNSLLLWELVVVFGLSVLAMSADRFRTLRGRDEPSVSVDSANNTSVSDSE